MCHDMLCHNMHVPNVFVEIREQLLGIAASFFSLLVPRIELSRILLPTVFIVYIFFQSISMSFVLWLPVLIMVTCQNMGWGGGIY